MTYTLMIVEDELLERQALQSIISNKFEMINIIGEADNGRKAIELAKNLKPDIILLDIGIPDINGLEAQKIIIQFLPQVQTIILTAYSDFTHAQQAVSIRVNDYLLKPIRTPILIESIHKAIENIPKKDENNHKNVILKMSNNNLIQQAINLIEGNYNKEIQLNWLANEIHLNPQYFSRLFKKEVGISFSEFLTLYRIEKAKTLLMESDFPIYRIANEVGFSDASYFCKVFGKHTDTSPNSYRRIPNPI